MKRRSLTAALLLLLSAGFALAQNPPCPRPDCPRQGNCPRKGVCPRGRQAPQQSGTATPQQRPVSPQPGK